MPHLLKFKIRTANYKDLDSIVLLSKKLNIYHQKFDKRFTIRKEFDKEFRKFLKTNLKKKNFKILVAEVDGKIVGYSIGKIEKTAPAYKEKKIGKITDTFVLERYRKYEIGSKFLEELIKWFKRNGIKEIEVSVHVKNKTGLNFWKKQGFRDFTIKMVKRI